MHVRRGYLGVLALSCSAQHERRAARMPAAYMIDD